MHSLIFDFALAAFSTAGAAVLWRNWLEDHPRWKEWIGENLGIAAKALTCGSCFTYWLALAVTLSAGPLSFWLPFGSSLFGGIASAFMQWMALSFASVFLRFAYVVLQETVHYQMHVLREPDHIH